MLNGAMLKRVRPIDDRGAPTRPHDRTDPAPGRRAHGVARGRFRLARGTGRATEFTAMAFHHAIVDRPDAVGLGRLARVLESENSL